MLDKDVQIGKKLREVRQVKNISQATLATAVNITFQQVQKYEKGVNRISASRLIEMCEFLDISPMVFFKKTPTKNLMSEVELHIMSHIKKLNEPTKEKILLIVKAFK